MVDFMDKMQNISNLGKSTRERQKYINVSEVFYVWDMLVAKMDILETIQIKENFIDDTDLKFIAGRLLDGLKKGITYMENVMDNYGIPFPIRPPASNNTTFVLEQFTDRDIYISLFETVHSFFPILVSGFMNSTNAAVRKNIKEHLLLTMELHELMVEYGKLKGFLIEPPIYRA